MLMTPGLAIAVNSLQVWMGQIFTFEVDKINLNNIYLQKQQSGSCGAIRCRSQQLAQNLLAILVNNKPKFKKISY